MKTKILLSALLILNTNLLPAQSLRYSLAQPYISLSAYSSRQIDPLSFTGNQAALARVRSAGIGVFGERRFMLSETSAYTLGASLPTRLGNVAIQVNYAGFKNFNENKIGLAFAKKLGENFSAAVQLDYLSKFIGDNYGKSGAIAAEFGVQAKLAKGLFVGAHVFNPTRAKSADYNKEKIPTIIKIGANYVFSEKVFWAIEAEKDINYKPNFKTGIEYRVIPQFYLRAGVSTQPTLSSFGFGLRLKQISLDVAATYHQQLGFTPHLGFSYRIK